MSKEVLLFIIHSSTAISLLPIVIMLWYRKSLLKQSYGIAILGMYVTFFLSAIGSYITCYFVESSMPSYHIFIPMRGFFVCLLFVKELENKLFKIAGIVIFLLILCSELLEFTYFGGVMSNNNLTALAVNLTFIIFYVLYIIDAYKYKPETMFQSHGIFPVFSVIFGYEVIYFLFSMIENDLAKKLLIDPAAVLLYSISLLLASFLLWRNLSALNKEKYLTN